MIAESRASGGAWVFSMVMACGVLLGAAICAGQEPPRARLTPCLAIDAAGRPIRPTATFVSGGKWMNAAFQLGPDEKFTKLESEWVVVDVGGVAAPGTVLAGTTLAVNEFTRDGAFNYSQSVPLPVGRYKLVVKADGKPWSETEMTVVEDGASFPPESGATLFPLVEGSAWDYEAEVWTINEIDDPNVSAGADGKVRVRIRMTVGAKGPDGTRVVYSNDGRDFQEELWVATQEGLMLNKPKGHGQGLLRTEVEGDAQKTRLPELFLGMPQGPMTEWTYPPQGDPQNSRWYRMWGPLPIETPQGQRPGYVVVCRDPSGMLTTDTREYVPEIGLVRQTIVGAKGGQRVLEANISLVGTRTATGGAAPEAAAPAASGGATGAPYRRVENGKLSTRLGRIVIAYPADADCSQTQVQVFAAANPEKPLTHKYGSSDFELMSGKYIVDVGGVRLGEIEVAGRQDAVIAVGVLRVRAGDATQVEVFDTSGKKLTRHYGSFDWGLPVGEYQVSIMGQTESIKIRENEITEF